MTSTPTADPPSLSEPAAIGAPPTAPTPRRRRWSLRRMAPAGLVAPAAAVVAVGALAPFIILVLYSVGVLGDNEPAGFHLYGEIVTDDHFVSVFVRTVRLALVVTVAALVVAVPLAFQIARAGGWLRTLLMCLVVLPLLVNIVVRNLGWVLVLSSNGVLNSFLSCFGLSQSFPGTTTGIGIVLVHVAVPLVVLPLLASIDQIQPARREAALSLGAHPLVAFVRITLPSVAPGMLAGAVLTFVIATGSLVTPMFLGQGRLMMVPTLIVQQIQTFRWERAAAMSIVLFVIVVGGVVAMQRFSQRLARGRSDRARARGQVLRPRPFTAALARLNGAPGASGVRRWAARVYLALISFYLLLPMAVILKTGVDSSEVPQAGWNGFTTRWLARAFSEDGYRTQLLFSLRLAIVAVVLGLIVSAAASWAIVRFRFPGRDAVVAFLMSPLLIPQAALAVGFVLFFIILSTGPSFWRLLFAHVVVTIPYMTRVLVSTFENVEVRMEEAASALGARPLTVFRRITLPMVRSGVFTACLFGFLQSFDEAAISVLLASGDTTTLPIRLLSEMQFRPTPVGAAISTFLIACIVVIIVPLERRLGLASSVAASPRRRRG